MILALNQTGMDPFEPGRDLKVLVAYERMADGMRACRLLERVGLDSGAEGRLICSWWKFEALAKTPSRRLAAIEAAEAGMIVFAATDAAELPEQIIDWISRALAKGEYHPRALVALLGSDPARNGHSPGLLEQLKKMALLGQMNFFANGGKGELEAALTGVLGRRESQPAEEDVLASWRRR